MTHAEADASDASEELGTKPEAREAAHGWDQAVLAELLALDDTLTVVLTDGAGEALCVYGCQEVRADLAEVFDVALGALARVGDELTLGAPQLLAARYAEASLVASLSPAVHAVVLAKVDANLGQLLLLLRQLLSAAP